MSDPPVRAVRPRNRRQLVVDAAGPIFSARGYHGAGMEDIAAAVGITAAALYRHFPNKYALFVECVHRMVDRLLEVVDALPGDAGVEELIEGLARTTVAHRASGGIYRWEARYLEPDDRDELRAKFAAIVAATTAAVEREHPGDQVTLRATAALGAVGSITVHQTTIAARRAERLLTDAALRVVRSAPVATGAAPVSLPPVPESRTRRGQILDAAIPLFRREGYSAVTMSRIAADVGVAPSAIYRHYPGKADILAAACLQAASLLGQATEEAFARAVDPGAALRELTRTYVAYSVEHTDLTSVAEAEVVGLPEPVRGRLTRAQREHVGAWERQLRAIRPELDGRQARVLVHAGLGVVVESGRSVRWQATTTDQERIVALVLRALGV